MFKAGSTLVLEVISPSEHAGRRIVIHPDQKLLVGRTHLSDIVFDHYTLSRRQTWLWCEEGQFRAGDAGSTGGSYLDGEQLEQVESGGRALPIGSILGIGGLEARVCEGAPDLTPTVAVGDLPRLRGEAAERDDKPPPPPPPAPRVGDGRFVLHTPPLGRGNHGVVHRAYDEQERCFVAVKVLDPPANPDLVQRFLARAAAKATQQGSWFLRHLAWGVEGEKPYLAMELAEGGRLSDRLPTSPLTLAQSVKLVRHLAQGAGDLHAEGMVHRNIKPSNVHFAYPSSDTAMLSDVWIDLQANQRWMVARDLKLASLGYVAPELLTRGEADPRADVYSLAAILYRCVAGCMPVPEHDAEGQYGALDSVPVGRAQPLLEVRPDAPRMLADLLGAALSPSLAERPADGRTLHLWLGEVEKDLGIARDQRPPRLQRTAAGRRPVPSPRAPVDPLRDSQFQEELNGLVTARLQSRAATPWVAALVSAFHPKLTIVEKRCALCGTPYAGQQVVEVRCDPMRLVRETAGHREMRPMALRGPLPQVTPPFVCRDCLHADFAAGEQAVFQTLSYLSGRDDDTERPFGPTRRELREGLTKLLEAARPRLVTGAECELCGSRTDTLSGDSIRLCLRCVERARATEDTQLGPKAEEARIRPKYAELLARAEARLASVGMATSRTKAADVRIPSNVSKGDWHYTDVESLEREQRPSQARIDEVATKLASSLEAHVVESLRAHLVDDRASRSVESTSGLPSYVKRFVLRFRPSAAIEVRLDVAIAVLCELLNDGYRFEHQVEDYEWQDATDYFAALDELLSRR